MRPHGKAKRGFFPLARGEAARLKNCLAFASEFSVLDPCVDPLTSPTLGGTKALGFGRIGNRMKLYIIAGPNGVGKTTFARTFLPKYADCKNFINADLIAQGMSPFSPETAAVRAGRLMLNEIRFFAQRRATFAFETTLSGRSYLKLIRQLKKQGYEVHIFFLWVKSVEVALSRVRERVLKGGHDVPDAVVRRRFGRSISNFLAEYRRLADSWYLFDNSGGTPTVVAFERAGKPRIMNREQYQALIARYGDE
jgi:predicted ABC-type ATPase